MTKDLGFKAEYVDVHSGPACGKRYIKLSMGGEVIACIHPISVESYGLGCESYYFVKIYGCGDREWGEVMCSCFIDVIYAIFGKGLSILAVDVICTTIFTQLDGAITEFWR